MDEDWDNDNGGGTAMETDNSYHRGQPHASAARARVTDNWEVEDWNASSGQQNSSGQSSNHYGNDRNSRENWNSRDRSSHDRSGHSSDRQQKRFGGFDDRRDGFKRPDNRNERDRDDHGQNQSSSGDGLQVSMEIELNQCGTVIGRQGANVKDVESRYRVRVQLG